MITAVTTQKGGVGKTTAAIALSHGLALAGATAVLVDLDAQGNAAAALGQTPAPHVTRLLLERARVADLCLEIRPNFWLLPGDATTAALKTALHGRPLSALAAALAELDVDHIIIDTSPSRDLLHTLAYHAADRLVIPTTLDYLGIVGVAQQFESLADMRAAGRAIEVTGLLPTFWDATTNESERNLRDLVERFGDLVVPAIPRATRLREGPARGLTPWEILPAGKLRGYEVLVERTLGLRAPAAEPGHAAAVPA
jgi:chromosome partitioning protein